MLSLEDKFRMLGVDSAPGQEVNAHGIPDGITGECLEGRRVDFSHGDVDAFTPIPGSYDLFTAGFEEGAPQAYTEYRGRMSLREYLAGKLAEFSGSPVSATSELIVTPGTQGALFLAMGAAIMPGDKVAVIEPDYFANRKLVTFFGGELVPVGLDYYAGAEEDRAGIDLAGLERAFADGARLLIFSNPNNPTGAVYTREELVSIAELAQRYGARVICD